MMQLSKEEKRIRKILDNLYEQGKFSQFKKDNKNEYYKLINNLFDKEDIKKNHEIFEEYWNDFVDYFF